MTRPDNNAPKRARQPQQLACGVEIVGEVAVDLRVLVTEYFLIGQATTDDQLLLEIRVANTSGSERRCLPESLRQSNLEAAARLVELLRLLLRQS